MSIARSAGGAERLLAERGPERPVGGTAARKRGEAARYPGSEASPDDGVRLSRRTEWREVDGGSAFLGLGQRMIATDAGEYPLLEVRSLEFDAGGG